MQRVKSYDIVWESNGQDFKGFEPMMSNEKQEQIYPSHYFKVIFISNVQRKNLHYNINLTDWRYAICTLTAFFGPVANNFLVRDNRELLIRDGYEILVRLLDNIFPLTAKN